MSVPFLVEGFIQGSLGGAVAVALGSGVSLDTVDYDLGRIWRDPETREVQREIWDYKCPQCWTPCEAYQTIAGNMPKALLGG